MNTVFRTKMKRWLALAAAILAAGAWIVYPPAEAAADDGGGEGPVSAAEALSGESEEPDEAAPDISDDPEPLMENNTETVRFSITDASGADESSISVKFGEESVEWTGSDGSSSFTVPDENAGETADDMEDGKPGTDIPVVDTIGPEIDVSADASCVNTRDGVDYYDSELTYTFVSRDMNLEKAELEYTYTDILTGLSEKVSESKANSNAETGTDLEFKFTIGDGQQLNSYKVTAWDRAGHTAEKGEASIQKTVDTSDPAFKIVQDDTSPDGTKENEDHYGNEVKIKFEVTDLNIDEKTLKIDMENVSGREEELKRKSEVKDGSLGYFTYVYTLTLDNTDQDPSKRGDVLTGFEAVIKDLSGRTVKKVTGNNNLQPEINGDTVRKGRRANNIVIDKVKPKISIRLPNTPDLIYDKTKPEIRMNGSQSNSKGNTFYYNTDQTAAVVITDANLVPEETSLSYKLTGKGKTTVKFSDSGIIRSRDGASYKLRIPVGDGETFSGLKIVKAADCAGNKKTNYKDVQKYRYIVDKTAPALELRVNGEGIANLFTNGDGVYVAFEDPSSAEAYAAAPQAGRTLTLTAVVKDRNLEKNVNAGFSRDYYVTGRIDGDDEWKGSGRTRENKPSTLIYKKSITVSADSSGAIVFELTVQDLAGNKPSAYTANSLIDAPNVRNCIPLKDGTVRGTIAADRQRLSSDGSAPEITLTPPAGGVEIEGGKILYSGNVSYAMKVSDPLYTDAAGEIRYSGLSNVSWTVTADNGAVISTANNENSFSGERSAEFEVPVMINGAGETNNIVVRVTAVDRAGNTITRKQELGIDTLAPRVTVSYDNQSFQNGKYYKDGRTATVTVDDLNFDAAGTTVNTRPGFSGWVQNGTRYTGTVTYSADGDYTFEMASADKADNRADIDYTGGGVNTNPQAFTIDRTAPVINVTFDNESFLNRKYFRAFRTAAVSIDEHNFRPSDVNTTVTAVLDGSAISAPKLSEWSESGDIRTAYIPFGADGGYTVSVDYTDLAGNPARPVRIGEFIVDTTPPAVQITNVKDRSAYQGEIAPSIRFYDVNFDPAGCSVKWTLTNMSGNKVMETEDKGSWSEIAHGTVFTFNDLPAVQENDGIYRLSATATDLAGNKYAAGEVMYSVNRFGSVYDVEDYADMKALAGGFTNNAPVLKIRETNPNILSSFSVSAAVNGTVKTLEEGKDFEVAKIENEGSWKQYLYTISEGAFRDDSGNLVQGAYSIAVYSEDEAGNLNSNRTNAGKNGLDMEFTIDAEKPSGYINVSGLLEGRDSIQAAQTEVTVGWEDNTGLEKADVYLNDDLYASLTGKELEAAGGSCIVKVTESDRLQNVYAILTDKAGNVSRLDPVSFYLNSSAFLQFLRGAPILILTIAGAGAGIWLAVYLNVRHKRKKRKMFKKTV